MQQHLTFAGWQLEKKHTHTLSDYDIMRESTLMVHLHKHIPCFVTTFSGRVINFEVDSSDTITNIANSQNPKEGYNTARQATHSYHM